VSIAVIDFFEMVDIDHHHGQMPPLALAQSQFPKHNGIEKTSVVETCERVTRGLFLQLFLQTLNFGQLLLQGVFAQAQSLARLAQLLVVAAGRAHAPGQFTPARIVVGMDMGVDDVGDANLGELGLLDKPVLVARQHIDGDREAVARAAEEVREGRLFRGKLLEKYGVSP
jgi:hypothetical protein